MSIPRPSFAHRLAVGFALAIALLEAVTLEGAAEENPPDESPSPTSTANEVRADDPPVLDFDAARVAIAKSCGDCHGEAEGEGGFSLAPLDDAKSLVAAHDEWMRVRRRLADGSMPPDDAAPLPMDERMRLVQWVDGSMREAFREVGESGGPPMFRRLTAHEYSNTIRDLLAVHFDAGHGLPQDIGGGEGFDNAAETLTISPIHAEKFLGAATDALNYAATDATSRALVIPQRPSETMNERAAAVADLTALANRAFRRPVAAVELRPYLRLFNEARSDGLDFEQALFYSMRGVLTSPKFLFLSEAPPRRVRRDEPLSEWELATRLSYFLWASMPDAKLREAADAGRLSDPAELRSQTLRMLDEGEHLDDSLVLFVGQWLGTADLGRTKTVDLARNPWIQDHHVAAMRNQPVYIFRSLLRRNRSLLELIDADWTFLNDQLLEVYQIDRSKLKKKDYSQNLERVSLPPEYRNRGGLLGAGGVLTLTAYPHRSSPVLRGVWVLDKMLGVKLPPPPPNVPDLAESGDQVKSETLRERLQRHRADPTCATCHNRIDPVGFALENFDEIGRWRDRDDGGPIDPVGQLPGGIAIDGVAGLKQYLLENKTQFARHLTEKMLGYALARGLTPADYATVEAIVARLEANEYRAQELVLGIVESKPFRFKRGQR